MHYRTDNTNVYAEEAITENGVIKRVREKLVFVIIYFLSVLCFVSPIVFHSLENLYFCVVENICGILLFNHWRAPIVLQNRHL